MNLSGDPYPLEIDVRSVQALRESDQSFLLLDCREPSEVALAAIGGSHHLPMGQTPARIAELEPYRQQRVVVMCHHGMRSEQVALWLREMGFDKAQNMIGGIDQWSREIDASLPRY